MFEELKRTGYHSKPSFYYELGGAYFSDSSSETPHPFPNLHGPLAPPDPLLPSQLIMFLTGGSCTAEVEFEFPT